MDAEVRLLLKMPHSVLSTLPPELFGDEPVDSDRKALRMSSLRRQWK